MIEKQPSPAQLTGLCDALESSLRLAGAAILDLYVHPEHAVRTKKDFSPVTDADLASHDLIVPAIGRLTPEWMVISEEDLSPNPKVDPRGIFWLIDPLDGTKEFIARTGEFCINVGLVSGGRPIVGLIYDPVGETLYRGGQGVPAQCKSMPCGFESKKPDGPWQDIAVRTRPASGGVLISSRRSVASPENMQFERRDHLGSALKFTAIASGRADYYFRKGNTMEWDTCAGQAILESAGGRVVDLSGASLSYGKSDWLNHGFIAQGRG